MIYNRFTLYIIFQLVLILVTALVIAFSFTREYMLITRYSFLFLFMVQGFVLIHFTNRTNRALSRFLGGFSLSKDLSPSFPSQKLRMFGNLNLAFDRIVRQFEAMRREREKESQFLTSALQQVNTGLLAFNESGRVLLANKALFKLFGIMHLGNISELGRVTPGIPDTLDNMQPDEIKLIRMQLRDSSLQLSLRLSIMKQDGNTIRLVSFHDIGSLIDQKEIEAWQKIIRVINHEVINSLSPVNILSSNLLRRIESRCEITAGSGEDSDLPEDLRTGLRAIKHRSQGLTQFVERYRSGMQLPDPKPEKIRLSDMLGNLHTLFREELQNYSIALSIGVKPAALEIHADKKMIEQVIINLIRNSVNALKGISGAQISIRAGRKDDRAVIVVSDNGKGIPEEHLDNIFVPFFSAEKGGSGIGLSLSKQIIRLHNGEITASSPPGKETTFRIIL